VLSEGKLEEINPTNLLCDALVITSNNGIIRLKPSTSNPAPISIARMINGNFWICSFARILRILRSIIILRLFSN
jgi:hypothetical protein